MATVTLTATNYSTTNVATVTNASNAYTDTTSSTYAQVTTTSNSASKAYFYGFDFSQIPNGATISSVTYKIKVKTVGSGGSTFYVFLENRNTSSVLSAKTSTASTTSETVVTLIPTSATWSDIVAMGDNFAFCVQHSRTTRTQNVYGMEIDVTYTTPEVNKVIYGNNTLIDLTSDTVTAADVASGKTFHLANGAIGTGINTNNCDTSSDTVTAADVINSKTFHLANGNSSAGTCTYNCNTSSDTVTAADVASGKTFHLANGTQGIGTASGATIKTETGYPNSYGITFRELANEPTWFLVACMSPGITAYSTITFFMLYNGTTTYIMNGVGSSGSRTQRAVYSGSNAFTFSYTSGVLAISGNINNFNIPSTYETYTLYYI